MHNIHETLLGLATPIDDLLPLANNPRFGNVDAIRASYEEFGQMKPIVVRPNGDGTATVIAGNHQLEAARQLGWTHIAAVPMDADDARAVAFALADNRTMELGHTDEALLHDALVGVLDDYAEVFEALGWDEFELASMEEHIHFMERLESGPSGFVPPTLVTQPGQPLPPSTPSSTPSAPPPSAPLPPGVTPAPVQVPVPAADVDQRELVTRGATVSGQSGSTKAVVQYTLAFDTHEQQRRWYDFLRWLRNDPGTEGETTAERLLYFLDSHVDY